jgi:ABC-type glutathione transport system ATPase component
MTPLLEVSDLTKVYPVRGGIFQTRRSEVRALDNVSTLLNAGESLGLVGESGSGKTTMARILAGFLTPTAGRILWEGKPHGDFSRAQWAGHVQMVFQDPSASLNPKLSVGTLLSEPLRRRTGRGGMVAAVETALAEVGLPADARFHYPHQFSGGQKQRIAIARALAAGPKLLIADEPVSALDLSVQAQILNLLADLRERSSIDAHPHQPRSDGRAPNDRTRIDFGERPGGGGRFDGNGLVSSCPPDDAGPLGRGTGHVTVNGEIDEQLHS